MAEAAWARFGHDDEPILEFHPLYRRIVDFPTAISTTRCPSGPRPCVRAIFVSTDVSSMKASHANLDQIIQPLAGVQIPGQAQARLVPTIRNIGQSEVIFDPDN
jgi:hypothetical protein